MALIFIYSFTAVSNYIKDNENKDPREIIIDELIGQSIPIFAYEISHGTEKSSDEALIFYCICFVLFRLLKIFRFNKKSFEIKVPFQNTLYKTDFFNDLHFSELEWLVFRTKFKNIKMFIKRLISFAPDSLLRGTQRPPPGRNGRGGGCSLSWIPGSRAGMEGGGGC